MYFHQDNAPLKVTRGQGAYLYLENGQPVLDAISSWWVNLHGHRHPKINTAIRDQLESIEQVILAGFTHQPIEDLAQRLVDLTPAELTRVFFC
jgi:adenosylmethionine-8-amino-7-oxononanoate aminotransferase